MNKQQLQDNNTDLSRALSLIGDLPIKALVEAAARVGKYVWKRYEIPAPLAVASKSSSGNYIVITLDSSQDLSGVSEQSLDGATITLTETNGYEVNYTLKYNNGSKTADCSDDTYDTNYSYSAGVLKLGALAYLFPNATCSDITMPASSDYVFVVSNSESAHPDGGTQDGYYYERVSEGIPFPDGYTKFAVDKITPASDKEKISVNHSLGDLPRIILLTVAEDIPEPSSSTRYYVDKYVALNHFSRESTITTGAFEAIYTYVYKNGRGHYNTTNNTISPTAVALGFADSYPRFKAGVEYTLITMA